MSNVKGQSTGCAISWEGMVILERHSVCTFFFFNLIFTKNKGHRDQICGSCTSVMGGGKSSQIKWVSVSIY